jgi:hypothetical protein
MRTGLLQGLKLCRPKLKSVPLVHLSQGLQFLLGAGSYNSEPGTERQDKTLVFRRWSLAPTFVTIC